MPVQALRHHPLAMGVNTVDLKHRLRQIETYERRRRGINSLMRGAYSSSGTSLPGCGGCLPHHAVTQFRTRREAKAVLFEYIEIFCNRRRWYSGIGYRTPAEAHEEMLMKVPHNKRCS
jgi:hypothetical protein